MAVDGNGNVIVTGSSVVGYDDDGNSIEDYHVAKYAAADGVLLWEKHYNGPANGDDFATRLALGPYGMVAVTGWSFENSGSGIPYEYATIVYREALPSLSIMPSNAVVIVSWPANAVGYHIEENTNLSLANSWSSVAQSMVTNAGQISVTISATTGSKFFRLKSQ